MPHHVGASTCLVGSLGGNMSCRLPTAMHKSGPATSVPSQWGQWGSHNSPPNTRTLTMGTMGTASLQCSMGTRVAFVHVAEQVLLTDVLIGKTAIVRTAGPLKPRCPNHIARHASD